MPRNAKSQAGPDGPVHRPGRGNVVEPVNFSSITETNVGSVNRDIWGNIVPPPPVRLTEEERHAQALARREAAAASRSDSQRGSGFGVFSPEASQEECSYRHSGWAVNRQRVTESMARINTPIARRERFRCCGALSTVERSPSEKTLRVRGSYCHDRLCVPCGTARSAVIASVLERQMSGKSCRFLTLTLRHWVAPLAEQMTRLLTCFRRLRDSIFWRACVVGGASFFEVKRSKNGRMWHPHLHIIIEGKYMDQATLSRAWLAVTGDSKIVHIAAVPNDGSVARYVSKYASKPIDSSVYAEPDHLDEACIALRGRRLCTTFGTWRGLELELQSNDPGDWTPVCSVTDLVRAKERGETWAVALWHQLKRTPPPDFQNSPP